MEPSVLDVFQHPKFEDFLSVSKSWKKIGDLKNIFGNVLLELTHVVHSLKRGCDVDRVTDMILKRARNKKYFKLSLEKFKKSESSWLESLQIKEDCEGCKREVVEEGEEVEEEGDVGEGQNDQLLDANNQLEELTDGQEDEEEKEECEERCCRKGGQEVEDEDDVFLGEELLDPASCEEPPSKRPRKEKPYSQSSKGWRYQMLAEEVERISRDPQLEKDVMERLKRTSVKRSREQLEAWPSQGFFDEHLSCFNCISGGNMSMNTWDFFR